MILYNLTQKLAVPVPLEVERRYRMPIPVKKLWLLEHARIGDLVQFTWLDNPFMETRTTFNLLRNNECMNFTQSTNECLQWTSAEHTAHAKYCTKRLSDWTWKEP